MSVEDYNYDVRMETYKWIEEIPYLQFKESWEVTVIPPFGGAVVRFLVKKGDIGASVYLDCYDKLGCYGEPYWEVYASNEPIRFPMLDTKGLMDYLTSVFETPNVTPEP